MRFEAITWEKLSDAVGDRVAGLAAADGGPWRRVAVDGHPAAEPGRLAERLADALRVRGRPVLVVGTDGFLRRASVRFEYGREDPDAYYDQWLDTGALWREVFDPLGPGGAGRVLPDLWDPVADRATRSSRVALAEGGVLLLHGPLLLGRWFPFDLSVHLSLSAGALARRRVGDPPPPKGGGGESERWALPAFARYEEEVRPCEAADIVVRADDPRRPAWNGGHPHATG